MAALRGELGDPPQDFDRLVAWFDGVSQRLVLAEELPLSEVHRAVVAFASEITVHRDVDGGLGLESRFEDPNLEASRRALRADHDRLAASVRQLWWLDAILGREDHGGNRQALGQYGRIAAEALRRHRTEEREWFRLVRTGRPGTVAPAVPSNDK